MNKMDDAQVEGFIVAAVESVTLKGYKTAYRENPEIAEALYEAWPDLTDLATTITVMEPRLSLLDAALEGTAIHRPVVRGITESLIAFGAMAFLVGYEAGKKEGDESREGIDDKGTATGTDSETHH